jgi:hypothetical protein
MKYLSLFALTLSLNAFASSDCDRVLNDLVELGVVKGTNQTMIDQHKVKLAELAAYQNAFDNHPRTQTFGAYDRELLSSDIANAKADIKRLENDLRGLSQIEPKIKAAAKNRCR